MDDTRPFSVICDWCATPLAGEIRREQAGQMVVLQVPHVDPNGRPCQGSGRAVPTWPLHLEVRASGAGYELLVGRGATVEFSSPEALVTRLHDFGLDRDEALRRIAAAKPGEPSRFDVPERRRETRRAGVKIP